VVNDLLERLAPSRFPRNAWLALPLGRARCLLIGRLDDARRLDSHVVEVVPAQLCNVADALHLFGDRAAHPDRSTHRAARRTAGRHWRSPSRVPYARSSPTATSATASSTGARASASRRESTAARRRYREMAQAQVEMKELDRR
jgi:hypothetical protein